MEGVSLDFTIMAIYKQSVDFLPKLTHEEEEEKFKVSKASLYAAVLPLFVSIIWVIAVFINSFYKNEVIDTDAIILQKEREISSFDDVRSKHTELVLKVDVLKDLVQKNFYPQRFFDYISRTISSTGDAQAEIYAYGREDDGTFNIQGKANSYLDLAKIMVVFNAKEEFSNVEIKSIRYDKEVDNVNFEINFIYTEDIMEAV